MADRRRNNRNKNIKKKRTKKTPAFSKTNKRRLSIVFGFMIVCFIVLIGRLVWINYSDGEKYQQQVMTIQSSSSSSIAAKRGDILDRNGTVLATGEKIYNLILDPYVISNSSDPDAAKENTVDILTSLFDVDEDVILDQIENHPDSHYYLLKQKMTYDEKKAYDDYIDTDDEEVLDKIDTVKNCFWFAESYVREYNYNTLACDVLGFVSADGVGQYGLESYYNDILSGIDGKTYGVIDENVDLDIVTQSAQNGKSLLTTLDVNVQRITEKYIQQFMDETGAANVAAIVMDPNNGEILAMASAPVFNCNNPQDLSYAYTDDELKEMSLEKQSENLYSLWRNFCVNDCFEPGSTAKTMTVSYAMDLDLISDKDTFVCDGGQYYRDGTYVSCNSDHGTLTLSEAIEQSCNDAMMQIGDLLGVDNFLALQTDFGLGEATGIDLPDEQSCEGLIYTEDTLGPVELWTSSFGQGYNMNMVQMASAFCSIVNGGYYYKPHIVKEIQNDSGSTVQVFDKTLVRNTISEATSEWMRESLYQTVEEGTGHYAQVSGYKIGGKTGTAEKLPRGTDARLVSFIGAAPIDDPQLVVYVVVDEPNAEDQGQSSFAQIIAGKIFAEALPYLQIFPTEEADDTRISYSPEDDVEKETETDENGEVIENAQDDQNTGGDEASNEADVEDGSSDDQISDENSGETPDQDQGDEASAEDGQEADDLE